MVGQSVLAHVESPTSSTSTDSTRERPTERGPDAIRRGHQPERAVDGRHEHIRRLNDACVAVATARSSIWSSAADEESVDDLPHPGREGFDVSSNDIAVPVG
jgi:hypothetical protein